MLFFEALLNWYMIRRENTISWWNPQNQGTHDSGYEITMLSTPSRPSSIAVVIMLVVCCSPLKWLLYWICFCLSETYKEYTRYYACRSLPWTIQAISPHCITFLEWQTTIYIQRTFRDTVLWSSLRERPCFPGARSCSRWRSSWTLEWKWTKIIAFKKHLWCKQSREAVKDCKVSTWIWTKHFSNQ